jgi:hypothetical protein
MSKSKVEDAEVTEIPLRPLRPEPPLESGAVETEQAVEYVPLDLVPDVEQPPVPRRNRADLTGPQVAEIKRRNDDVDKAAKAANDTRDEAIRLSRLAQYAQSDLSSFLRFLQEALDLDPAFTYTIDLDRGQIVPVPPR